MHRLHLAAYETAACRWCLPHTVHPQKCMPLALVYSTEYAQKNFSVITNESGPAPQLITYNLIHQYVAVICHG